MNKYIVIISCLFFCSSAVAETSENSSVQIGKTKYTGAYNIENNQFIFRGIPYANHQSESYVGNHLCLYPQIQKLSMLKALNRRACKMNTPPSGTKM